MKNVVKSALAVAMTAAVMITGALMWGLTFGHQAQADGQGRVAEVVVRAEMPRLVTDTVYVSACRSVAALASPSAVN